MWEGPGCKLIWIRGYEIIQFGSNCAHMTKNTSQEMAQDQHEWPN